MDCYELLTFKPHESVGECYPNCLRNTTTKICTSRRQSREMLLCWLSPAYKSMSPTQQSPHQIYLSRAKTGNHTHRAMKGTFFISTFFNPFFRDIQQQLTGVFSRRHQRARQGTDRPTEERETHHDPSSLHFLELLLGFLGSGHQPLQRLPLGGEPSPLHLH